LLTAADLDEVTRIDALHTGEAKPSYWQRVFGEFLGRDSDPRTFGVGVDGGPGLAGYLFGEIRAAEFGSEACGWVFAVGVDPAFLRGGTASALLNAACGRFREEGLTTVRTMVRRNDVPVLSFFRSRGFHGGPYVQLELELETE
jgi:ribosomal protein S18 acetylase RimI-like enzyme